LLGTPTKGSISAEELKLQMGEVLPNAIPLMAKAAQDAGLTVNGTVKEMMKLQQTGGLISSKVLPHFAKRMSEAARANGGLDKALLSNRVSMNRLTTSVQNSADTFFKSGFSEGLTELFNTTADMVSENQVLWDSLGKVASGVLKGISFVVENVINPVLSAMGSILHLITEVAGKFSAVAIAVFGKLGMSLLPEAVKQVSLLGRGIGILGGLAKTLLMPFTLVLGVLEEVAEFFAPTGKKTLIGFNIDDLQKFNPMQSGTMNQRSANPLQFNTSFGPSIGNQRSAPIQLNNNLTVTLDGEKVAENVVSSSTFEGGVNRALNSGFVGSR
jgi:hypothetical protein